jgi:DNA-binding CsgD family transcriptional regulator
MAAITGTIADGIRSSLRFDAARRGGEPGSPGLAVLDRANRLELVTPPARELMAELRGVRSAEEERPPTALLALAEFARTGRPGRDSVAVPGRSGWITLHASLPEGDAGRVAIVLERGSSPQTTAVRLELYGVTAREREIATLLSQGLSNGEIAAQLFLSPYTVQDHVKRLLEKTGVGSRQELIARVFLDDYLPRVMAGAPLTSGGGFVPS